MQAIIIEYGQPEEIAEAYREIEAYTRPIWVFSEPKKKRNIFVRFFGVFVDLQAWRALIYEVPRKTHLHQRWDIRTS